MIDPKEWPVLVTGAGGFIGGHVARHLASLGHPVYGLTRKPPEIRDGDPDINWIVGDLRSADVVKNAVSGMRGVIHTAGWVSLGADHRGDAAAINVDATKRLLEFSSEAGVERFVFTSTLHTVAAGTASDPADEDAGWNLHAVDSPYSRTKREAEEIVRAGTDRLASVVLCPGMVLGPRDIKPTSTRILLLMAKSRVVSVPNGGIPIVDTSVIAQAHGAALMLGVPGERYAVVGHYVSYPDLARMVRRITGRPNVITVLPDFTERLVVSTARMIDKMTRHQRIDISAASAAGGYLRLHVSGTRADRLFNLVHPDPISSIHAALVDAKASGRNPFLGEIRSL